MKRNKPKSKSDILIDEIFETIFPSLRDEQTQDDGCNKIISTKEEENTMEKLFYKAKDGVIRRLPEDAKQGVFLVFNVTNNKTGKTFEKIIPIECVRKLTNGNKSITIYSDSKSQRIYEVPEKYNKCKLWYYDVSKEGKTITRYINPEVVFRIGDQTF